MGAIAKETSFGVTPRIKSVARNLVFATCIAAFALAPSVQPLSANVFDDNKIVVVSRDKFPQFDGIGIVKRAREVKVHPDAKLVSMPFANAVIIGPCTVLTNYHVNFGDDLDLNKNKDYNLQFSVGWSNSKEFDSEVLIKPIIHGDRSLNDFSINRDESCSGLKYGFYKISPYSKWDLVRNSVKVISVWYHPDGKVRFSSGRVVALDDKSGYVQFSASTTPGSSGGAIFIVDEKSGELLLQGINVGAIGSTYSDYTYPTFRAEKANEFMSIEEIVGMPDVSEWLGRRLISAQPEAA